MNLSAHKPSRAETAAQPTRQQRRAAALSSHQTALLKRIAGGPQWHAHNGIATALIRRGLAEYCSVPNPYLPGTSHTLTALGITDAGRAALAALSGDAA